MSFQFEKLEDLQGKFVKLSAPTATDYPALKKVLNDKLTMESLIPFFGISEWTDQQVRDRYEKFHEEQIQGRGISWAVHSLLDKIVVGNCGFKNIDKNTSEAEFGIILHRIVWSKGHSLESHLLSLKYGFEILKLKRIYFNTDDHNQRMKRFFDKVGIRFVQKTNEGYLQYELNNSEWPIISSRLEEMIGKIKIT